MSGPTHGLLSGTAPALTYTPATDYLGTDSFTFKANDGLLDSNIATVSINVIQQNPYIQAVSLTNLYDVAAHLVEDYGPRRVDVFRPYSDNACTLSTTVLYPKSNMEMADDYLKALYESWGYQVTLEEVDTGYGVPAHNVVATKIGSVYPNIFIDVGGHLDTQPSTPGAGDNASGSTAVVEIARVLKDYPNRYSIRFINDVGHETCGNCGMAEHVRLLLARGETIKAGLMMDGIGWSIIPGVNNNEVWWNSLSPGTERIVDMFGAVRSIYGIDINFKKIHQPYGGGDGQPYLDQRPAGDHEHRGHSL